MWSQREVMSHALQRRRALVSLQSPMRLLSENGPCDADPLLVKAALHDGDTVTGRIVASDDDAVRLDVDGTTRELAYADVAKALVQVEFNRPKATNKEGDA